MQLFLSVTEPIAHPLLTPLQHLLIATVGLLTLSGCVTGGYKLADSNKTQPPVALALAAAQAGAGLTGTLEHVIIYKGPGSWKREAHWDEYVLALHNGGTSPVTLTGAELASVTGDPSHPGEDPWKLERLSKKWWQSNAARQTGTYLALGAGTVAGAGLAIGAAAASLAGAAAGTAGSVAAGATAGAVLVVALPVVAGGTVYMNVRRKHQIEEEFNRRRLALPKTLQPGETARGSLFFRVTPAPQQLTVRLAGTAEGVPRPGELSFDLAPLASLHVQQSAVGNSATASPQN